MCCAERTDTPRQLRRSPDGSIETAFALVTGAGEVGRVVSGEGSPNGHRAPGRLGP